MLGAEVKLFRRDERYRQIPFQRSQNPTSPQQNLPLLATNIKLFGHILLSFLKLSGQVKNDRAHHQEPKMTSLRHKASAYRPLKSAMDSLTKRLILYDIS